VARVEPSPLLLRPFIDLLYQPWMIDGDDCGTNSGIVEWQEKPEYSEKTFPSDALSTTDPGGLDPGSNPGRRGGKPELRHGLRTYIHTHTHILGTRMHMFVCVCVCVCVVNI
jgi:hypothetical protein